MTEDFRIELHPDRKGVPPLIKLDDDYKFVDQMEVLIPNGVPSLLGCTSLKVDSKLVFDAGVVVKGDVKFKKKGDGKIPAGTYETGEYEF